MIMAWLSRQDIEEIRQETEREYSSLRRLGVTEIENFALLYDVQPSEKITEFIENLQTGEATIMNQLIKLSEGFNNTCVYEYRRSLFQESISWSTISFELGGRGWK